MKGINILPAIVIICTLMGGPLLLTETRTSKTKLRKSPVALLAAEAEKPDDISEEKVTDDGNSALYVVMTIVLIIWVGLSGFLFRLDRKVSRLERDIDDIKEGDKM